MAKNNVEELSDVTVEDSFESDVDVTVEDNGGNDFVRNAAAAGIGGLAIVGAITIGKKIGKAAKQTYTNKFVPWNEKRKEAKKQKKAAKAEANSQQSSEAPVEPTED